MVGSASCCPDPSGGTTQNITCSLTPLCAEGPDALKPQEHSGIAGVQLTRVDLAWENEFHEVTIKCADDLFQTDSAGECPEGPIPPGAHPTRAVLKVHFENLPAPHFVEIRPPATIIYQDPADAPRLATFLSHRKFTLPQKLAHIALILLALATAVVPDLDDDDDEPDDDNERILCPA